MLTTIYKQEDGTIDSLHLHAQTDEEKKELAAAADHFNRTDSQPIAEPQDAEEIPVVEPEPEPEVPEVDEPEPQPGVVDEPEPAIEETPTEQ